MTRKTKKSDDQSHPIALPCRLFKSHLSELAALLGHRPAPKAITLDGLVTDAYVLPAKRHGKPTRQSLEPMLGGMEPLTEATAQWRGRDCTLLLPQTHDVAILHVDKLEKEDERQEAQKAASAFRPVLETWSRLTGLRVEMEISGQHIRAPFPADEPVIHILAGANPPGDQSSEYQREAFGLPLDKRDYWVLVRKPTRGRGVSATDGKIPVVQILGRTVYPLIPLVSNYRFPVSKMIFEKFIALACAALRDKERGHLIPSPRLPGQGAIQATLAQASRATLDFWKGRIRETEVELDRLRKRMVDQLRLIEEYRSVAKTFDAEIAARATERSDRDVKRLRRHKLVRRVYSCDEGIHVDTRPIIARHEGIRYLMGSFTIRLGCQGDISVWGLEPAHPQGIPHPHLPKDGVPCFGTASEPITLAGAEFRMYDAVSLVLRWLQEGYTPRLSDTAIEQWPLAEGGKS